MNIIKYDPFREMRSLQDEVNRLFTSSFSRGGSESDLMRGAWSPQVDIFENKNEIVLEAELAGMKATISIALKEVMEVLRARSRCRRPSGAKTRTRSLKTAYYV
jgi:HSP20 family protein